MRGKAPEEKPNQCVRKAAKKLCCEIMQYNGKNITIQFYHRLVINHRL